MQQQTIKTMKTMKKKIANESKKRIKCNQKHIKIKMLKIRLCLI
jgi:hypothetical protein